MSAVLSAVMFGCEPVPGREKIKAAELPATTLSAFAADTPVIPDSLPLCGPEEVLSVWTDDELEAMARTLAGECYDHKAQDKRRVCEVILNRVSDGRFGGSIIEVLTAKKPV